MSHREGGVEPAAQSPEAHDGEGEPKFWSHEEDSTDTRRQTGIYSFPHEQLQNRTLTDGSNQRTFQSPDTFIEYKEVQPTRHLLI